MGKSKRTRTYSDPIQAATHDVLERLAEDPVARESFAAMQRLIDTEDTHWSSIFGAPDDHDGLSLEEIKKASESIREGIVKSPTIDRGAQLRHSYVWSKGINLPKIDQGSATRPGAKTKVEKILKNPITRRYFLDGTAHEELERALYSDGNLFALADSKKQEARIIPLSEITAFITNPDFASEIWAWKREWKHDDGSAAATSEAAWYYTDDCPLTIAQRATKIKDVPVDKSKTIVVHSVNRQVGWPLGIPDAIAAIAWAKLYSEFLKHGYVMSRALASIAFRATVASKSAGENASMKLANTQGAGNTAVMGAANSLTALPTAGRGYDFDSGRPIAAMVATAVQVSIVHLLSDPGAAGSSYGSASNLDLPTKRAILARQQSWADFLNRLFAALGYQDARVTFPSLEEPDFFREVQSIIAGWATGLLHEDEVRTKLIALLSIETEKDAAPAGVMLPNNEKSWARNDVDPKEDPDKPAAPGSDQGTGQGHSTGAGKGPNANDLRSDGIGEAARMFEQIEIRDLIGKVMERLDQIDPKSSGR